MQIISPDIKILFPKTKEMAKTMLKNIENAARICYKSINYSSEEIDYEFIRKRIDTGHLSVIEHSLITVKFICDRGITHELVRHRLASYSQESTRYCNYRKKGIEFIDIYPAINHTFSLTQLEKTAIYQEWLTAIAQAETHYKKMIDLGASPQIARSVLPNSLKAEIVVSANFREWRHILKQRTAKAAHPQMREVMGLLLVELKTMFPVIFGDIENDYA